MEAISLFFITILFFSVSFRGLIQALTTDELEERFTTGYSRRAIRVGRAYKVFAWGLLVAVLFYSAVVSFISAFLLI